MQYKLKSEYIKLNAQERLYHLNIPIIGLTGGIATGKSSVVNILRQHHFAIIDADKLVKQIYQDPETIKFIAKLAPECVKNNIIIFKELRSKFFKQQDVKTKIETFIYKKLPQQFKSEFEKFENPSFIIYDVPLLFEKKLQNQFDFICCVYTTPEIQISRIQQRDGTELYTIESILKQQIPIDEKKMNSNWVIENTGSIDDLVKNTLKFIQHNFLQE
jgi:dephospho-CoA kinase